MDGMSFFMKVEVKELKISFKSKNNDQKKDNLDINR